MSWDKERIAQIQLPDPAEDVYKRQVNLTFRHCHRDPVSLHVLKMALPLERSFREDLTIKLLLLQRLQKLL